MPKRSEKYPSFNFLLWLRRQLIARKTIALRCATYRRGSYVHVFQDEQSAVGTRNQLLYNFTSALSRQLGISIAWKSSASRLHCHLSIPLKWFQELPYQQGYTHVILREKNVNVKWLCAKKTVVGAFLANYFTSICTCRPKAWFPFKRKHRNARNASACVHLNGNHAS